MGAALIEKAQKRLLENDEIVRVKVDIILPRVGGYSAKPYDSLLNIYEMPRVTEIKSLWRWWLRVVYSACNCGSANYQELDAKVGEILGSTFKSSKFSITLLLEQKEHLDKLIRDRKFIADILAEIFSHFEKELLKQAKMIIDKVGVKVEPPNKVELHISRDREPASLKVIPVYRVIFEGSIPDPNNKAATIKGEFEKALGGIVELECKGGKTKQKASIVCSFRVSKIEHFKKLIERYKPNLLKDYELQNIIKSYRTATERFIDIPRIRLLTLPRKEEDASTYLRRLIEDLSIPERLQATIVLHRNRSCIGEDKSGDCISGHELKVATASFLLSLILGGLGSITSRGLGSIIVKGIEPNKTYAASIGEIVKHADSVLDSNSSLNLEENIKAFMGYIVKLTCKDEVRECPSGKEMPGVPTLIPGKYFHVKAVECHNLDPVNIIATIGDSCLKVNWKALLNMKPTNAGGDIHTWILGLPRRAGHTGYFVERNKERRPSAIRLKYLESRGGKKFVLIYGFLSRDWPLSSLVYRGRFERRVRVSQLPVKTLKMSNKPFSLENVFNSAFEFVTTFIENKCGKSETSQRR